MMGPEIIWWLGQHLLITTALAAVVWLACRLFRLSPAARHVLWLLVLCRLTLPFVAIWPCSLPAGLVPASETTADTQLAVAPVRPELSAFSQEPPTDIVVRDVAATGALDDAPVIQHLADTPVVPPDVVRDKSTSTRWSWYWLAAAAWAVGSLMVATLLILRIRRVGHLLNTERIDSWLNRETAAWCHRLGVRTPECVVTGRFRSPFLWCLGRVRLVWPSSLADLARREQSRPILVHELAHLKRRDHWTAWVEVAALVIWWWNPLFWLVRRQLRSASEMACDAWVVELLPGERRAYAESLVEFSRRAPMGQFAPGAVGAHTGSRRVFKRRLELIMNEQVPARFSKRTMLLALLLGLISFPAFSTEQQTAVTVPIAAAAVQADTEAIDDPPAAQERPAATPSAPDQAVSDAEDDGPPESSVSLNEVLEQIAENYYGPVDRDELERAAIEAVLSNLDAYSQLLSREQLDDARVIVDGELAGVGIAFEIDDETKLPTVTRPIRHSPAHAAGIRTGDAIVRIDGEPATGLNLREVLERIRGPRGSTVTLGIRTADETRDVEIIRDKLPFLGIEPWSVSTDEREIYRIDADGPGYVHIPGFTKQTAPQLRQVLAELNAAGVSGLVLDLRNCGGGLLTAATDVADMFLDEGIIVSSRGRSEDQTMTIRATGDGTFMNLRLAVLVNGYTASAAEILAACLQDHHRAAIIGERTFGRGTVQSLFPLNDGGALKLTTATWLRPNGRTLQRIEGNDDWGVRPDAGYAVPLTDEVHKRLYELYRQRLDGRTVNPGDDPQLQAAIEWLEIQEGR